MAEFHAPSGGSFERRMTKAVGAGLDATAINAANIVKSNFLSGQSLNVRTGTLRRSIRSETDRAALIAKIGPLANSPAKKYAPVHEFGAVITPVRAKALRFTIEGKTIFAKSVHIPARPYLRPGVARGAKRAQKFMSAAIKKEFR